MGFADHASIGVGSKDAAEETVSARLDTQVAVRPRVYTDRLPKNVQQDESEMIGPIFDIGGQNAKCFNIESELHHKITRSEYFKRLYVFKSFKKVVDVIYEKVTNVAPWIQRGQQKRGFWKTPSSAFCLLLKLFHLKLTEAQVRELLDHPDSPYIRAIGMLYVRYGSPSPTLWKWLGPYCDDLEEFTPGTQPTETCSLGKSRSEFAQRLLTSPEPFYETELPRIMPIALERRMLRHVELHTEMMSRAKRNKAFIGTEKLRKGGRGFLCCAQHFYDEDDENDVDKPLTLVWRTDGLIDMVEDPYDGAPEGTFPSYRVTFESDRSTCIAKLGMIDFPPEDGDDDRKTSKVIKAVERVLSKKRDAGPDQWVRRWRPRRRSPESLRRSPDSLRRSPDFSTSCASSSESEDSFGRDRRQQSSNDGRPGFIPRHEERRRRSSSRKRYYSPHRSGRPDRSGQSSFEDIGHSVSAPPRAEGRLSKLIVSKRDTRATESPRSEQRATEDVYEQASVRFGKEKDGDDATPNLPDVCVLNSNAVVVQELSDNVAVDFVRSPRDGEIVHTSHTQEALQSDGASQRYSVRAQRDGDFEGTSYTNQKSQIEEAQTRKIRLGPRIAVEDWPRGVAGIRQEANATKISFKLGPRLTLKATKSPAVISAPRFSSPTLLDCTTPESLEEASAAQTLQQHEIVAAPPPPMPSISAEEVQALRREVAIARAKAAKIDEDTSFDDNRVGPDDENAATATLPRANAKLTTVDPVSLRSTADELRPTADDPFPGKRDGHRERRRRRRRREDEDYDSDDGRRESRRARREKSARRRRHKRDTDDADRQSEDSRRKRRRRHRASRKHGGSKRRRRDDGNYEKNH